MAKKKIKVVCYCRVSTSSKEQYNSFENQKEFFEKYIKEHPEYELYKSKDCPTGIYADRGISGTHFNRPQFELMLKAAGIKIQKTEYIDLPKKDSEGREMFVTYKEYTSTFSKEPPEFTLILVKNTSRFARNIVITDIIRKLSTVGVYVKFIDIDKSTENESDLSLIYFFQTFDEMYSRDLSRKLLSANQQSRDNEILRSNHDLYGYQYHKRKSRAENNYLTIIPKEAQVIQKIFRLYLGCFYVDPYGKAKPAMPACDFKCSECPIRENLKETAGMGFRSIMQTLNDVYGYRTRKGKTFAQSTLKHIFENEKYCGYLNNGKWDHGPLFNKYSHPKLKENYKDYLKYRPDLIPPIISLELFDLCTAKREGKADIFGTYFRGKPTEYKGKMYCGACGWVMTHNIGNNGNGLYNCRNKKLNGSHHCSNGNIYDYQIKEIIERLCTGELSEIINQRTILFIGTVIKLIEDKLDFIRRNRDDTVVEALHQKITERTNGLANLYKQKALSTTDLTAIQMVIDQFEQELPKLKEEYAKITKKPAQILKECAELKEICYTGLAKLENQKTIYTEEEMWEEVEKFVIYSEVQKLRGGMHGPPKVSAVPVLKTENTLSTQFGIDLDPTSPIILTDFGLENENFTGQVKNRLNQLEEELHPFEALYL